MDTQRAVREEAKEQGEGGYRNKQLHSSFSTLTPFILFADGEMDAASVISHASNDSEDFVIVIPDCFDLDKPLAGFSAPDMSHDNHMTPLANQDQEPEQQETLSKEPPTPTPQTAIPGPLPPLSELPSHVQTSSPKASASPLAPPKGNFGRVTFQTVKDGRFCNPLTIATGFVNSMSDFVEEHIHFTPSSTNIKREPHTQESDNEEVFEVNKKCFDNTKELCVVYECFSYFMY